MRPRVSLLAAIAALAGRPAAVDELTTSPLEPTVQPPPSFTLRAGDLCHSGAPGFSREPPPYSAAHASTAPTSGRVRKTGRRPNPQAYPHGARWFYRLHGIRPDEARRGARPPV